MKYLNQYLKIIIYLFAVCGMSQSVLSPIENTHLVDPLSIRAENLPHHSIYISTDKDIYETEEDLWFNAVMISDNPFIKDYDDKIFYLELLGNNNLPILSEKYEIKNGIVDGHLYLPDSLSAGNYILTGFTANSIKKGSIPYKTLKYIDIKKNILPEIIIDYEYDSSNRKISFQVYLRKGGFMSNTKFKLVASNGNTKKTIAKGITDSKGYAELVLERDNKFSSYYLDVMGSSKSELITPLNIESENKIFNIEFSPEGGHLVNYLEQRIGFKITDSQKNPVKLECLLFKDEKVIDTLKSDANGLGSFTFLPDPKEDYSIESVNVNQKLVYALPDIDSSGIILKMKDIQGDSLNFKILSYGMKEFPQRIYVRIQSKGQVHKMLKGMLKANELQIGIPLKEIPSGIIQISIYNDEYECMSSRLIYIKPEHKLYITEITDSITEYRTRSKVARKLRVTNNINRPVNILSNVTVYDKLYAKNEQRTMESFFMLENDLSVPVTNAQSYFNNYSAMEKELDLLMLTTKKVDYKWDDSNYNLITKKISIEENVYGRVLKKTKNNVLIPIEEKIDLQLIFSLGVLPVQTNDMGVFVIDREILIKLRGEKIFLRGTNSNQMIELMNTGEDVSKVLSFEARSQAPLENSNLKENMVKVSLDHIKLNSMNFLEEVVVKAPRKSRLKGVRKGSEFYGSGFDYVCTQYDILNCENHNHGTKPIEGKVYELNDGSTVTYRSPEYQRESTEPKNYITIECLYPKKNFREFDYSKKGSEYGPDFRKMLYWKTGLSSNASGEVDIKFYTSDIRGAFVGKVDIYSDDGLLFGSYLFDFNVR